MLIFVILNHLSEAYRRHLTKLSIYLDSYPGIYNSANTFPHQKLIIAKYPFEVYQTSTQHPQAIYEHENSLSTFRTFTHEGHAINFGGNKEFYISSDTIRVQ